MEVAVAYCQELTGDIMNCETAADLARTDGIEVESVVSDDEVAVKDSFFTAGRRGVGVTVLAEKLCVQELNSASHQDSDATSSYMLLKVAADAWKNAN